MIKITGSFLDVSGRALRVTTENTETKEASEIILSSDFCHYCIDDLATQFADFMKTKGYDIASGKS